MRIPFPEFLKGVHDVFPDARTQVIAPASYVHVFDADFLKEEFWPVWQSIVFAVNSKVANQPLQNNARRGICDEITARFKAECAMSTRQLYGDEDVGPGVLEATVMIPAGYELNRVPGFGAHRTAILAVTQDGANWQPIFVEPQLSYAHFKTTALPVALDSRVHLVECWV